MLSWQKNNVEKSVNKWPWERAITALIDAKIRILFGKGPGGWDSWDSWDGWDGWDSWDPQINRQLDAQSG